jgi:hypothetical protein
MLVNDPEDLFHLCRMEAIVQIHFYHRLQLDSYPLASSLYVNMDRK